MVKWPGRPAELTPFDYSLWGYSKSKVYLIQTQYLEALKLGKRQKTQNYTANIICIHLK